MAIPLAVASMVFLATYAIRVLARDLPEFWQDLNLATLLAAWALFGVDYAVRWRLSGLRLRFVHTHLLDTVVLLLPLLRPVRIVRVYEKIERRRGGPRLALHARVIMYAGLSTLLLGFAGALAVFQQERGAPDATMRTFGDAVWWTCATFATVGYGDVVPVTPMGRLIAVGMMGIGLALLGAVTGTFASWLLQTFSVDDDDRDGRGDDRGDSRRDGHGNRHEDDRGDGHVDGRRDNHGDDDRDGRRNNRGDDGQRPPGS
jgi:voltage-gated potassium channel